MMTREPTRNGNRTLSSGKNTLNAKGKQGGNVKLRDNNKAIAGRLIQVDEGEYSDYCVKGFFVCLRNFDPLKELDIYLSLYEDQKQDYGFSSHGFLGYLTQNGYLLEINRDILYLGAYSDSQSVSFRGRERGDN
jgi:hypothetical protein